MIRLIERKEAILDFIRKNDKTTAKDIKDYINGILRSDISKMTISRDLVELEKGGLVVKVGKTKGSYYQIKVTNLLLSY